MTGHFTSYENRTDHELATSESMRALGAQIETRQRPADLAAIPFHHTQQRS
jgi:hypothetical protein